MGLSNVNVGLNQQPFRGHMAPQKMNSEVNVKVGHHLDDRPINSSGYYNISNVPLDEIEIQEDFNEIDAADDQDWDLLESIMGRYNQILTDEIEMKSVTSLQE